MRHLLLALVLTGCAAADAPATDAPPGATDRDLVVRVVGASPEDASQLRLAVRWVAGSGLEALPADLDDDTGVVAFDGDLPLDDNAVYFDPDSGELAIDLDAVAPGPRVLRVQARHDAAVSPWLEIPVSDRRLDLDGTATDAAPGTL